MKILLGLILTFCLLPAYTGATVYVSDSFNSYANNSAVSAAGWGIGNGLINLQTSGCYTGKCMNIEYTTAGTSNHQFFRNMSIPSEGYIAFYVKFSNIQNITSKILKFFNSPDETARSNFTLFEGFYTSRPSIGGLEHGGNSNRGDIQCFVRWYNSTMACTNGTQGTPNMNLGSGYRFYFPENTWTKVIWHWKQNTNGNANGLWECWVNGTKVISVTNVINRSDTNPLGYYMFSFGDYTSVSTASPWYMWIDDVIMASTYNEANGEVAPIVGPTISLISPTYELSYGTTSISLQMSTTTNSTLKYSTSPDISYSSMPNTFNSTGGTSHSTTVSTPGTYYVRGSDSTGQNQSDFLVNITVASTGCPTDASLCNNQTDCSTYWPALNWDPLNTPPCSSASPTTECAANTWWFCTQSTTPTCTGVGMFWDSENSVCDTIPFPTDITGNNLITNGDFRVANALNSWSLFYPPRIELDLGGRGLHFTDVSGVGQNAGMVAGTSYRFLANVITGSIFKEWTSGAGDNISSATGTITGIAEISSTGDNRLIVGSYSSSSDLVINNIRLYERLTTPCNVANAGLCDETGCLALDPTHYWWGSYCHDTPEVTVRVLFNHSSTGNVGHTSGAGSVSFQH